KEDLLQAVELLDHAVARDPSFFAAYCELAGAHDKIYFSGFDHSDGRLNLAYREYDGAKAELAIAKRSLPNESRIPLLTGYIDRRQGHWEKSLEEMKQALQ